MLILGRKWGERIIVTTPSGEVVTIEWAWMRRGEDGQGRVGIGVTAAAEVRIDREEIHRARMAEATRKGDGR